VIQHSRSKALVNAARNWTLFAVAAQAVLAVVVAERVHVAFDSSDPVVSADGPYQLVPCLEAYLLATNARKEAAKLVERQNTVKELASVGDFVAREATLGCVGRNDPSKSHC